MKRTKKKEAENDGKILFKKIGRGSFRFHGKIIKPGQEFLALPEEITQGMKDVIIPLEDVPNVPSPDIQEARFELKHRGGGYYDVVHSDTQKRQNEKTLRKKEAEELIKTLEE